MPSTPSVPQPTESTSVLAPRALIGVNVAGISIVAQAAQPEVLLDLPFPESRFLACPDDPTVKFGVRLGEVPASIPGELVFRTSGAWRLYSHGTDTYVELFRSVDRPSALRLLRLDSATDRGELTVSPTPQDGLDHREEGVVIQPFLQPLLQLLVYWRLAAVGGMGFHAGGVAFGDLGCLFMGVSGMGKSTITRICLNAGAASLSDDRVAVNLLGGAYHLFGTPWHGTPELSRPAGAPLRAAFFIEHGPVNELVPLSEREACGLLVARAFAPHFSAELMATALASCSAIAASVPCYRLRFVPNASVVDLVLAAAGGR